MRYNLLLWVAFAMLARTTVVAQSRWETVVDEKRAIVKVDTTTIKGLDGGAFRGWMEVIYGRPQEIEGRVLSSSRALVDCMPSTTAEQAQIRYISLHGYDQARNPTFAREAVDQVKNPWVPIVPATVMEAGCGTIVLRGRQNAERKKTPTRRP